MKASDAVAGFALALVAWGFRWLISAAVVAGAFMLSRDQGTLWGNVREAVLFAAGLFVLSPLGLVSHNRFTPRQAWLAEEVIVAIGTFVALVVMFCGIDLVNQKEEPAGGWGASYGPAEPMGFTAADMEQFLYGMRHEVDVAGRITDDRCQAGRMAWAWESLGGHDRARDTAFTTMEGLDWNPNLIPPIAVAAYQRFGGVAQPSAPPAPPEESLVPGSAKEALMTIVKMLKSGRAGTPTAEVVKLVAGLVGGFLIWQVFRGEVGC